MDKNLKNALIIIVVLVGVYYFMSPYESCLRETADDDLNRGIGNRIYCNAETKW